MVGRRGSQQRRLMLRSAKILRAIKYFVSSIVTIVALLAGRLITYRSGCFMWGIRGVRLGLIFQIVWVR